MILTATLLLTALATTHVDDRVDRWREDLTFLAAEFQSHHVDPYRYEPEEEYQARVEELLDLIPDLTDTEIVVELMRLVGLAGDSHSGIRAPLFQGSRLPVLLYWFDDGIRVVATLPEHRHLVGARLDGVADWSLEEVVGRMNEATAFGNEPWKRDQLPGQFLYPNYLNALGLGDDPGAVELALTLRDGEERTEVLRARPALQLGSLAVPPRQGPTARRPQWHSFSVDPEPGILYVQYNKCMTSDEHPLPEFTERLAAAAETEGLRAIVFDLQYNTGGSSFLGDAMFARVFPLLAPAVRENTYCVIGRRTFSSGLLNASRLKQTFGATLVGEETGGSPNHFGEVRTFQLPNSGLTVAYSTREFRHAEGEGLTLAPDLRVVPTCADFMAGRDVVWDAILEDLGDR